LKNQQASDIFRDYLTKAKYRITKERFEIMDAALIFVGHFSAEQLYIALKNDNSTVSRATVYNTLELLAECNLLSKRNFGENIKKYESNYKRQKHDHIICIKCGKIVEFESPQIAKWYDEISKKFDFDPVSYSFNIFARCKNNKKCN